MDPRALDLTELTAARTAFRDRFVVAPNTPLDATPEPLLWSELAYAVSLVPGTLGRGVIVFLGLENTTIRYGLAVVPGTKVDAKERKFDLPEHPDLIVRNLGLTPITASQWDPFKTTYLTNIRVDRTNGFEVLNELDSRCIIQPWEDQLLAMHDQNAPYTGSPYVLLSNVSFTYTNEDGGNAGYRHQVAFSMAEQDNGTYVELVDDATYATDFRRRATDRGTGCPPQCEAYVMPK